MHGLLREASDALKGWVKIWTSPVNNLLSSAELLAETPEFLAAGEGESFKSSCPFVLTCLSSIS